jgi:hypothetical protein
MFFYNKLIIGGSLPAYISSFINQIPIIHIADQKNIPFPWQHFPPGLNFSRFHFPKQDTDVITNLGVQGRGMQHLLLYTRFSTMAALSGLVPFAGTITKIEVDRERKIIRLLLDGKREVLVAYNRLYIFDSSDIVWDLSPIRKNQLYAVTDWFEVHRSMRNAFEVFRDKEDNPFVWSLFYHISTRAESIWASVRWLSYIHPIFRNKKKIDYDFCAVSFLNKKQLSDIEYNENSVRLKILRMVKERKLYGDFIRTYKGKRYYKSYDIEFYKREIKPLMQDFYKNEEDIKFIYWTPEKMIQLALKYINHTNTTDFLNTKIFGNVIEDLGTEKNPLQKREYLVLPYRKCFLSGRSLPLLPKEIQRKIKEEERKRNVYI